MEMHSQAKRIGIMGGSFNPVHNGHLIIAQDAIEHLELSGLLFMPAAVPPHKQHLMQVEPRHRLAMLGLCVESDIRFSVSDMEVQRGGISYTFDTVLGLVEANPDSSFVLVVGSDTLLDMHNWYRVGDILELCDVATFMRPGDLGPDALMEQVKLPGKYLERLRRNVFSSHVVDISSSDIRMRVAEGLGIRYLVPPEVEMYICEHGLYRA